MSNEERKLSILSSFERRHFLRCAALAAVGTSGVAGFSVPVIGREQNAQKSLATDACAARITSMQEVEGKVAFITGGSGGIGLGIARAFVEAGMKVVIGYRTKSHIDEAMQQLQKAQDQKRVHAIRVDVTDRPGMERAAAETVQVFGRIHVLVNNAGVALPPTLSATSYADWDWQLNVNLNGPFNGVHAFLPHIQSHGEGGHILSTSSVMGLFAAKGGEAAAYSVSKYAVVGMMETLRAALAGTNIGSSVYCPGMVDSNIAESSMRDRPADSAVKYDPAIIESQKRYTKERGAMDPLEAGQLVLQGMRNNDLYIFTHPEYEQIIQERNEALIASIPRDLHLNELRRMEMERLRSVRSMYAIERDRKRCTGHVQAQGDRTTTVP